MVYYILASIISLFSFSKHEISVEKNSAPIHTVNYNVDLSKSSMEWKATKKTGEHSGTVNLKSGYIANNHGRITGGQFIVDLKSIDVTDIEDADDEATIIEELGVEDFFDIAKYPTAKFVLKQITPDKKAIGSLTIKDITKDITFPINLAYNNGELSVTTEYFSIDRTQWNLEFDNFIKDAMVDDEIQFKLNLVLKH